MVQNAAYVIKVLRPIINLKEAYASCVTTGHRLTNIDVKELILKEIAVDNGPR